MGPAARSLWSPPPLSSSGPGQPAACAWPRSALRRRDGGVGMGRDPSLTAPWGRVRRMGKVDRDRTETPGGILGRGWTSGQEWRPRPQHWLGREDGAETHRAPGREQRHMDRVQRRWLTRRQPPGKRIPAPPPRSRTPPSRSRPRPRIPAPSLAPPCGQPERPAWTRSVPFALLKEQGPHLGRGSRRWCRAALGETDGTMKADPPAGLQGQGAGSLGVRPPAEEVARPAPPPTWSRPYSLAAAKCKCSRKWAGAQRPYIYESAPRPPPSPPRPRNMPSHGAEHVLGKAGCGGQGRRAHLLLCLQGSGLTGGTHT